MKYHRYCCSDINFFSVWAFLLASDGWLWYVLTQHKLILDAILLKKWGPVKRQCY